MKSSQLHKDIMLDAVKANNILERIGWIVEDGVERNKRGAMRRFRGFEGHREAFQSSRTMQSILNYSIRDESTIKSPFKTRDSVKESLAKTFSMRGGKSFESNGFETGRKTGSR